MGGLVAQPEIIKQLATELRAELIANNFEFPKKNKIANSYYGFLILFIFGTVGFYFRYKKKRETKKKKR
jgi:hypothetical protein